MKVNIIRVERIPIQDFANRHGLSMTVHERPSRFIDAGLSRFYASFDYVEIKDGCMLVSESGQGNTVNSAIENYCKRISGKRLVYRATAGDQRREVDAPELFPMWEAP